jgi:MFS family permease
VLTATFRSLRHPRFRAFFVGQTVSVVGFWLQQIALSWLVYRLTKSPLMLGVVAFAGTIPMLVLSPIAGVIVDRADRRLVVLATQSAQMLQAFALAALTFAGVIRPEWIPWLAAVYGVAWAFDAPARQALLPLMVGGREDMANAIALNSPGCCSRSRARAGASCSTG